MSRLDVSVVIGSGITSMEEGEWCTVGRYWVYYNS